MRETFEQLVARVNASAYIPTTLGVTKMARVVKPVKGKEFSFKATPKGGVGETKYPWDEWFAPLKDKEGKQLHADGRGELLLLEQSTGTKDDKGTVITISHKGDFEVYTNQMPPKIKTAARVRYKVVQVSRLDADGRKLANALIIRARDMTAEERTAEDAQRVIDRAKLKEALIRAKEKNQKEYLEAAKAKAQTNGHAHTATPADTESVDLATHSH